MNKKRLLFLGIIMFSTILMKAQDENKGVNVQSYTPSILINKGQTEFKLFNNLYTQTQYFNENSTKLDAGGRSTFFTSIMEYNYGVSSRFTIGGELWYKAVKIGANPLNVLALTNSPSARTGVSGIGLKVKFNPIKKWHRLSVQSSLLVNPLSDPESKNRDQPFLDNNRHQWITKMFYDKMFKDKFQIFTQLSTWVSIDKELSSESSGISTPLEVFASYFPNKKITLYVQNQIWPSWGGSGISSYFVQEGLGVKYQLFPGVELEGLYTQFVVGNNVGAGQTFNVGLRLLH